MRYVEGVGLNILALQKLACKFQMAQFLFCFILGYVINMETQKVAFLKYKDGVNPETTCWAKFANKHMHFLAYLRVYYVLGETAYEELGEFFSLFICQNEISSYCSGEYVYILK